MHVILNPTLLCQYYVKKCAAEITQFFWILGQTAKMSGRGQVFWHPEAILSSSFSILLPCHHHGGVLFASLGWSAPLIFRPLIRNLAESSSTARKVINSYIFTKLHSKYISSSLSSLLLHILSFIGHKNRVKIFGLGDFSKVIMRKGHFRHAHYVVI